MTEVSEAYGFRGRTMIDRDGDKIGKIDDVYEDKQTGRPEWALVNTGLFGTKKTFVPLHGAQPTGEDVRVPLEKGHVKDAPSIDADGELSESEERQLYTHYDVAYDTGGYDAAGDGTNGGDVSGPSTDDAMTRSEEELRVGTERREAGRVRLRKYVVTENEQRTVPVRREEVRVEREPITEGNVDQALDGPEISEEEHEVVLHEERPVVEKEVVAKERVRLSTEEQTDRRRSPRRAQGAHRDRRRRAVLSEPMATDLSKRSGADRRADYRPAGTDGKSSLFATVKRTFTEFSEDNMSDWAAALTYYGLLSLFPALIALVSIVGLVGDPATTTKAITDMVTKLGPSSAADTFAGPIKSITSNRGTAGVLFIVGLATALWSASAYVGAFMRAANIVYETPEGRPFWKLRPLQVLVTLVMLILLALVAVALVLTGPIVTAVAGPLGIGSTAVSIWDIAKWPVLLAVMVTMFAVLFYSAPNVKVVGFKWVTPGALLAIVLWLVASAAFAFYAANFGSYDKTYGTLGGLVCLLVWMWITNVALLLGMELNSERERSRELDAGVPGADRELQLDARSKPKRQKTT